MLKKTISVLAMGLTSFVFTMPVSGPVSGQEKQECFARIGLNDGQSVTLNPDGTYGSKRCKAWIYCIEGKKMQRGMTISCHKLKKAPKPNYPTYTS